MEGVSIVCLPAGDKPFRLYVSSALRQMVAAAAGLDLEHAVRLVYPHAIVRPPGRLSSLRGGMAVRYVYRDGEAARPDEPWWLAPGIACASFDQEGVYREANEEAAVLFGVGLAEEVVGRDWWEFATPDSVEAADRLWSDLVTEGALGGDGIQSTYHVLRPSGEIVPIEYRTAFDAATGWFRTFLRPASIA